MRRKSFPGGDGVEQPEIPSMDVERREEGIESLRKKKEKGRMKITGVYFLVTHTIR